MHLTLYLVGGETLTMEWWNLFWHFYKNRIEEWMGKMIWEVDLQQLNILQLCKKSFLTWRCKGFLFWVGGRERGWDWLRLLWEVENGEVIQCLKKPFCYFSANDISDLHKHFTDTHCLEPLFTNYLFGKDLKDCKKCSRAFPWFVWKMLQWE